MPDTTAPTVTTTPVDMTPGQPVPPSTSAQRAALAAAMLGFFVVALDAQIVNVALPAIRDDLGGGLSGLQWVVTGYTLMFASLQLFAGTFSDRSGSRRAYRVGMIIFIVASAVCAAAPTLPVLVAARILQGTGAALITPASLALIREAFTDRVARGRAIALWALGGSVAAAAGPVLGGAFTQLDWRLIFLVNLPVGAAAFWILSRVAASPRRILPFDWTGQIAAIAALAGLTYAIIEGADLGYTNTVILVAFGIAVAGAAVFALAQARGRHPMIPLEMFRSAAVPAALLVAFVSMAAFYGVVFLQSLYFQQLRGVDPFTTGLLFLPMTGLVAALTPLVGTIMRRHGLILPIIAGQLIMGAGLILLAFAPLGTPVWIVALLMVPVGVGGSFTVPPITALIMDNVPDSLAGTASGVLSTARQMGGSLGVAVYGAVLATQPSLPAGLRSDLTVTAAVLLALIPVFLVARRRRRPAGGTALVR